MMLGPWYVGDTPTTSISIIVERDGLLLPLDGYASASILLYGAGGLGPAWGTNPTIDTVEDKVIIPPPANPFALPGLFQLYLRLTTAGGSVETFHAASLRVLPLGAVVVWPPTLDEMKLDRRIEVDDIRDDERLTQALDAAVAFVERVRPQFAYDLFNPDQLTLPVPTKDIRLGTMRLAERWFVRSETPDMSLPMGELGSSRVPSFDPDIDRLLGIGRNMGFVFA